MVNQGENLWDIDLEFNDQYYSMDYGWFIRVWREFITWL